MRTLVAFYYDEINGKTFFFSSASYGKVPLADTQRRNSRPVATEAALTDCESPVAVRSFDRWVGGVGEGCWGENAQLKIGLGRHQIGARRLNE